MQRKPRKVTVALRMAGIAGQDKLNGIFEHLSQGHRWLMTLYRTRHEFTADTVGENLRDGTDGFIVAIPDADDALAELAKSRVPTVVMNITGGGIERRRDNLAIIKSDSSKIGEEAASEFLRHGGYQSYGYVGYGKDFEWNRDRGAAFARRLSRERITTAFHDRRRPLADWIAELPRPCALFAACDDTAYEVVDACRELGLEIPGEVAVLGVNNDPILCENSEPRLSSIQPDFVGEGRLAARLLERMMNEAGRRKPAEDAPRVHLVGIKQIVRRETTPPESISGLLVQRALVYIDRAALSGIGVDDVAAHLRVSRSLLDLRFREHLGESVYATILKTRLEEVKRRLREGNDPIGRIATECGWVNPASLKNLFKRVNGVSMREWRAGNGRR